MSNEFNGIIYMFGWQVYDFPWGTAVKETRTGKWHTIFLKPNAQEINVEHLNVILHEDGIQFV